MNGSLWLVLKQTEKGDPMIQLLSQYINKIGNSGNLLPKKRRSLKYFIENSELNVRIQMQKIGSFKSAKAGLRAL